MSNDILRTLFLSSVLACGGLLTTHVFADEAVSDELVREELAKQKEMPKRSVKPNVSAKLDMSKSGTSLRDSTKTTKLSSREGETGF